VQALEPLLPDCSAVRPLFALVAGATTINAMPRNDVMTAPLSTEITLADLDATQALACRLAGLLAPGDVVALRGQLGAGKTALARFVIGALCARHGAPVPDEVPSPTYTLVQTYDAGDVAVWHFDLYRLERPEDAEELAIFDAFAGAISLIEWPERLGALLPADHLEITLAVDGDGPRRARLTGFGPRGLELAGGAAR